MKPKAEHEKSILEIIKKKKLFVIQDIFAYYKGCCPATFYNLELEKLDSIKNAIDDNKVLTRQSLKQRWFKSENPTLQLALFKTIATEEDRKALSMNYQELTGKDGKDLNSTQIIFQDISGKVIKND